MIKKKTLSLPSIKNIVMTQRYIIQLSEDSKRY